MVNVDSGFFPLNSYRCLIIEDDEQDMFIITRLLRDLPFPIKAYEFQRLEAQMIQNLNFHFVLLDLRIIDQDPLESICWFQDHFPDIPVIIMSGQGAADQVINLIQKGAVDFLDKNQLNSKSLAQAFVKGRKAKKMEKEYRKSQEALLQTQKMEALSNLASGLAHDFNNMITGIQGYLDLAAIQYGQREEDAKIQNILAQMQASIQKLRMFKRHNAPLNQMDFSSLLSQQIKGLEKRHGNLLELSLEMGPKRILGNEAMLKLALGNLIENAFEAASSHGKIKITLKSITDIKGRNWHQIQISDNGKGIAEEDLDHIFEPFYTTKERTAEKGNGLGLTLVWEIIKSHKGHIEVESKLGEGTCFTIFLPESSKHSIAPTQKPTITTRIKRILIVDDEKPLLEVGKRILEMEGFEVQTAENGHDAYEILEKDPQFQLLLLDYNMPEMTGLQLLEQLKERGQWPTIMVSGFDLDEMSVQAEHPNVLKVMGKPFHFSSLIPLLNTYQQGFRGESTA